MMSYKSRILRFILFLVIMHKFKHKYVSMFFLFPQLSENTFDRWMLRYPTKFGFVLLTLVLEGSQKPSKASPTWR